MHPNDNTRVYEYDFSFDDGTSKHFDVALDAKTLKYLPGEQPKLPSWTDLDVDQCPNCPLDTKEHPKCPVAVNMFEVTDFFKKSVSYEMVDVTIKADERTYTKRATVQEALSSLFGIIMTTSGCPVLDKLRPMVRLHLPFATIRENLFRSISMYLTAQFFKQKNGTQNALSNRDDAYHLDGLADMYGEITKVNRAFCNRLARHFEKDANVNAVVILNCLAEFASISIHQDMLDELEELFGAYLDAEQ